MPILNIVDRAGESHSIEGETGLSIMEIIRDHGFDELLALCGGCCSCATCHIHIDPDYAEHLRAMTEDENDLLDSASERSPHSRLSCQLPFHAALDGMRVIIAQED